jgi:hypothetical protein
VSRYPAFVDLLRNEKPVWVRFDDAKRSFIVFCGVEPVGEGEM